MKIVLASTNSGKIKEIKEFCKNHEVLAYKDIIGSCDIIEDGSSFKQNAIIKAKTIKDKIGDKMKNYIVLADDSGISVPALGDIPGIYSARFAGENADDKQNLHKLISLLKDKNIKNTAAYYTVAMAITTDKTTYTVHGWMHGNVIDEAKGDNGFGYDPMFVPKGFDKTLGELDRTIKKEISHRTQAMKLAKLIINTI